MLQLLVMRSARSENAPHPTRGNDGDEEEYPPQSLPPVQQPTPPQPIAAATAAAAALSEQSSKSSRKQWREGGHRMNGCSTQVEQARGMANDSGSVSRLQMGCNRANTDLLADLRDFRTEVLCCLGWVELLFVV